MKPTVVARDFHSALLAPVFSLVLATASLSAAEPAAQIKPLISTCDQPFLFGFGSWEKAKTAFVVKPDGIHISAQDGQGGAGVAGLSMKLSGVNDWTPALTLTVGERNKAATLNFHLNDADGTSHAYKFDLRSLKPGLPQQVTAEYGASLLEPQNVEKPGEKPGVDGVSAYLIIGDWSAEAVEVVLAGIELVPPNETLLAGRAKLRDIKATEAEKKRRAAEATELARRTLLEIGAPHPADGPEVKQVCAVAPDVLAVTVQAGQFGGNQLIPYVAEPGDEIAQPRKQGQPWREVEDGKIVEHLPKYLYRTANQKRTQVGQMSPDGKQVFIEGETAGQWLDETIVGVPAAYLIESAEDPAYATATSPTAVLRKGKPNGSSQPLPFLYTISLRLPSPLKEGATYTIRFHGVNTSKEAVAFAHSPRTARSLAIHGIQTGYRPDDPYKRAYLSFWMGVDADGRHDSCTNAPASFELLDAAGKPLFTGKPELAKADGAEEQISIHEQLDYTRAAVHRLDFSDFKTPGAGGLALIYAYELTKKPAYLAAAVQGANYSLGANPDNLSYCTGVGDHAQRFNFIVDALVSGQQPDKIIGHIPYGQGNEGNAMSRGANAWVQQ